MHTDLLSPHFALRLALRSSLSYRSPTVRMGFFKRLTSGSKSSKPATASSSSTPTASTSTAPALTLDKRGEDALCALGKYDTVFLVDDSGSMMGVWEAQLATALSAVVKTAAQYDDVRSLSSPFPSKCPLPG